jgi:hypothetical protein
VLGADAAGELFDDDPVGQKLAVAGEELTVVGVLAPAADANPRSRCSSAASAS